MAHLTHKIDWSVIVDYYRPFKDPGISLPVGECGKIHLDKRKTELQVENRTYLQSQVCTDKDCKTNGTKVFRKNNQRVDGFIERPTLNKELLEKFTKNLIDVLREFALTELKTDRNVVYQPEEFEFNALTDCKRCDDFITLLEFGDKKKIFELSNSELEAILGCTHGGQAVGNNMNYLFYHVLTVYVNTNIVLYTNAKPDKWPANVNPENKYFWTNLFYACDGQTFLPHCRKYLHTFMKDVNETRELCKKLFKFMYCFVMVHEKLGRDWEGHIWF